MVLLSICLNLLNLCAMGPPLLFGIIHLWEKGLVNDLNIHQSFPYPAFKLHNRCGQTGQIIVPIFALIMEQKGTPNYMSQAKSAKVLTADCRQLYPVNYSYNSCAPNLLFSSTTSTRS